jgi:UDP-glucose 4-epimerase
MLFKALERGLDAILCRPCTVYGPRCTDGAGKAFSRPTSITAIPGSGKQLLANVRAEDVARAVVHLSELPGNTGQIYNIVDDSRPALGRALTLAAQAFGTKPPTLHLPLWLVKIAARVDGFVSARKGKIPDIEYDAARYLYDDYVVDNTKLKKTGFTFLYPDFEKSMEQIAKLYRDGKLEIR